MPILDQSALLGRCHLRADYIRAITALDLRDDWHVLDVSCAGGLGLELLGPLLHQGSASGTDTSANLVSRPVAGTLGPDHADLVVAPMDDGTLPFVDDTFDAIVGVHATGFWTQKAANEFARVLRPGGRLALVCSGDLHPAARQCPGRANHLASLLLGAGLSPLISAHCHHAIVLAEKPEEESYFTASASCQTTACAAFM